MNKEIFFVIIIAFVFFLFLYLFPVVYWLMAKYSGLEISIGQFISMRFKRIPVKKMIHTLMLAKKGDITIDYKILESHHKTGGNVMGLIAAKTAGIKLDIKKTLDDDKNGINIFEKVKDMAKNKNY